MGAGIILIDNQKRILLEQRRDTSAWGIVGGTVNVGESPKQAALRELKEETGLSFDSTLCKLLSIYGDPKSDRIVVYPDNRWHQIDVIFYGQIYQVPKLVMSEESLDLKFIPCTRLDDFEIVPTSLEPLADLISKLKFKSNNDECL